MTRLLLARHGLTDWNEQGRFQGQADIPLNESGRRQAQALARRLARVEIGAVYASDLQRAGDTARAICPRPERLQLDPRLRELNFGEWDGLTYAQIQARDPQALAAWGSDPLNTTPPGGESLRQLAKRVSAFLCEVTAASSQETLLVVAHGGPLQVLICQALGLSPAKYWQFHLAPASLSELAIYPRGAILNLLNDTSHLEIGADEVCAAASQPHTPHQPQGELSEA